MFNKQGISDIRIHKKDKRCGTCIWTNPSTEKEGHFWCVWMLFTGHKFPLWIKQDSHECLPNDYIDCPCWEGL